MKTNILDLKCGDYVKEIGLIKSVTLTKSKQRAILECLPRPLEYYGLTHSSELELTNTYTVEDKKTTIDRTISALIDINRCQDSITKSEFTMLKWVRIYNGGGHRVKKSRKKFKKVKKHELIEGYGIVLGNSKFMSIPSIEVLGNSYKYFEPSTVMGIGSNDENGFNEIVKVLNNNHNEVNEFIKKAYADVKDSFNIVNDTKAFLHGIIYDMVGV